LLFIKQRQVRRNFYSGIGGLKGLNYVKTYKVYRLDYLNNKKVLIGTLVERRKKQRKNNETDLLRLAQKLYAETSFDKLHIIVRPE